MGIFTKLKQFFVSEKEKDTLPRIDIKKRFQQMVPTGQGSMSKVYKTRDNQLGRIVCVKILDKEKTARFEARFTRLQKPPEGAICFALRHKNVVHTFEFGMTTDQEPLIIMELIEGDGLNYLIENRKLENDLVRFNYLIQAADGLQYIHKQGYLHRDVCPRNIMITKEGVLKIIDLGLSIPYRPEFCRPGNRTGTADFMAPEIIKRQKTDHRVDLFALGVTAFEVFTGTLPWDKARSRETMQNHVNIPGRDPRDRRPDLDEGTVKFLIKAVQREPKERIQTAKEFRDMLVALVKKNFGSLGSVSVRAKETASE